MNQSQETVTYSLETILTRMEGKIDSLQKDVTDLKVGQAVLTGKVEGIENRLNSLEGNQKCQVWALIVLLAGAIVKTFFLSSNP
ncbi:hemolysin XhlA family protein [Microcystis flos-aquae FACHB-1344]|uniref:Hemolysin XhlA family protein n=1 Tax=Microcystis flos-aquae FACHB-1344 TaxID=2692899 RepID=A0ABR8HXE0_9CHRO|nr:MULTISPECIES: hemolysin XhlA family protein [Microcystis]MBD2623184.1 hemolysin XhlA family protein [Microcystis flos-aquae FACHB-1344]MCA2701815.1 hemolysin XhlA family protein [Microcystis sp. M179S2]